MKNHNFKNFIKDIKNTSLTSKEKSVLFAKLDAYADAHEPVKKSPYQFSFITWPYSHIGKRLNYVLASLLILVLIGGTTVSASEKALPGDVLYPVKIKIAEPLRVALAKTPEAKERVELAHVEERLNEVEILAVQGRLATTTAVELQKNVDDHIKSLDTKLSKKNKEDLDIKMSAHSIVLKNIRDNSKDDQKSNIETIEKTVARGNDNENHEDSKPVPAMMMSAKVMSVQVQDAPKAKEIKRETKSESKSEVKVLEGVDAEREIKVRKEVENIDRKIEKRSGKSNERANKSDNDTNGRKNRDK